MRYRGKQAEQRATLEFNATPMVDVIFLLTVFFMLVSRFASAENIKMEVPQPDVSQAKSVKIPERILINCRPIDERDPGMGVLYSIGPNAPEPLADISQRLASFKAKRADLKVIIRADRRLRYQDVRAVMKVVASHNIEMLNIVAKVGEGE